MNSIVRNITTVSLLAILITACFGGGGFVAGIGGSGYISTGTVSGFGSVFVNGVEFETGSAIFEVEDASASEQDLRIGMVVQVEGSINADGITGTATGIRYGDQIEGPVAGMVGSGVIDVNADRTEKSFRVMGTNVLVDAVDTVYEGTGFGFDTIVINNVLEISGYYDQNDILHATFVELKASVFNPALIVEIEGSITGLSGTSFMVGSVNINASSANISDLPNGLQNGAYVEVKGTYLNDTITATEVEGEEIELVDDGSEVSIEGYITRYVSNSDFDINGFPVNASGAQLEPASLDLRAGIKVEAEGSISNGVLIATEVETGDGDAEIHATVDGAPDLIAGTFDLRPVAGQPVITIEVTTATTLEDDLLDVEPFTLSDLNNSDFVEVVGFESGSNTVTATKVKRRSSGDVILQGNATAATGNATSVGSLTLLGVVFPFDISTFSGGTTKFENESDEDMIDTEINNFINSIGPSTPLLVKIKDAADTSNNAIGIADEIDLED